MSSKPTRDTALQERRQLRDECRIYSEDRQVYAEPPKPPRHGIRRLDRWNLKRAGDNKDGQIRRGSAKDRSFGTIETRNRAAVQAVVDALAPFHRGDAL